MRDEIMEDTRPNKWLGSGWKMNRTLGEAQAYAESLRTFVEHVDPLVHLFIVPPFTALSSVCRILSGTQVQVGAQNMHWADRGAFTGEISPLMIRDCGAQIVELGHSERREYFAETDYSVNKKVLAALQHGLHPLICVGETAVEKEFDVAETFVRRQVKIALHAVPLDSIPSVMIAYEPVWAIGEAGSPAEPDYANHIHGIIRDTIALTYGPQISRTIRILYGGSVNFGNAESFIQQPEVDGLFIGRAAWEVDSLIELIRLVEQISRSACSI
jgi:triosephosphate isomerase